MKPRFTVAARADLNDAWSYIAADNPRAADALVERLGAAIERLPDRPLQGRPGRYPATRELVVPRTNYVVVYALLDDEIRIVRIMHGRQHWPPT